MRLEVAKYLYDVQSAAAALAGFVDGRSWQDYQQNAMLRSAVERQFKSSAKRWRNSGTAIRRYW
jgi:uncharacterized protein with HEPN domain